MEDGGGRMRGGPEEGRGGCGGGGKKKGEFEIRRTNPNDLGMSKNFFFCLHSWLFVVVRASEAKRTEI